MQHLNFNNLNNSYSVCNAILAYKRGKFMKNSIYFNTIVNQSKMEEFDLTINTFSRALEYIGLNLFDEAYRPTFRTYIVGFLMLTGHLSTFNAVYVTYPNVQLVIRSLSTYGYIIQVKTPKVSCSFKSILNFSYSYCLNFW